MKEYTLQQLEEAYEILENAGLGIVITGGEASNLDFEKILTSLFIKKQLRALVSIINPNFSSDANFSQATKLVADFLQVSGKLVTNGLTQMFQGSTAPQANKTPSITSGTASNATTSTPMQ